MSFLHRSQPLSVLEADAPITFTTYDCWTGHNNHAKSNKHYHSSLAPPKGEMKSPFSWTILFKSPTSSILCFGEPTLGKLCSHLQSSIKISSSASPSTFLFVTHLLILELHCLYQVLLLKQTEFPTATPA